MMTEPIRAFGARFDVGPLVRQLDAHPEAWNRHTLRTQGYAATPHKAISDIWVRFRDWAEFDGDAAKFSNTEHTSVWYPVVQELPAAWSLARRVLHRVRGSRLGGVLITRIPPGGEVLPHADQGWHAQFYEKFAVQVKGNKDQAFCFDGCELRPEAGDLYTFDNSRVHWVKNESPTERITLIVCIKRN